MLIMTTKLSKGKILKDLVVAYVAGGEEAPSPAANQTMPTEVSSNEDRLAYLRACGYNAESEPLRTQEVSIPKEFNEVFTRYNELQQAQGFDLSDYAGKRAKRYVYLVTDHPDGENVHATLIVYQDRVIAADLCCTEGEGFMRPLLPQAVT